jgi:nucleotide-binding universal stress UspA family protein
MYQRILVPVDGSLTSSQGLAEAIKLAKLTGASLRVIHAANELTFASGYEMYSGDLIGLLKKAGELILVEARQVAAASGVQAETVLSETLGRRLCDIVAEQVKAWHADLIVIGTHGRRGIGRALIGSDAEQIVRTASIPVLLVRVARVKEDPRVARGADEATLAENLVAA